MASFRVTQLRCGGLVVGCTFDHRAANGYSANMFWKSWAEMARSMPLSKLPFFSRSLLSPRRPGSFDSSITNLYIPISKLPSTTTHQPPPLLISRPYSVSGDQINLLQQLANHENPNSLISKMTELEAFAAFLWKLIASSTNTDDNSCRLGISIDGRARIAADGAMSNYFGNVVSHSFGKKKCSELEKMLLSSIANEIHDFLDVAVKKEHFLGLIDFVEAHRPEQVTYRMEETKVSKEEPALFVSFGRNFPVGREIDFGWGAPVFGSTHCPPSMPSSFVLPMPSPSVNGDWIVYVRLSENQIEVIENSAAHVFKPFSLDDQVLSSIIL